MLINVIAAIYLIVHGVIHLIGFVVFCQIAEIEDISYTTTVLAGKLDIGDVGTRVLGVVWLVIAVALVIAGVTIFFSPAWWWSFTLAVTVASLIVTLLGWPDAKVGLLANIIILLFLFIGPRLGWIAQ
jgi:hypothetical protein